MDVRLSPEQHALRDSVVQVVGHLAPRAVGALDDDERRAKLDAAVDAAGWRLLRTADDGGRPWASAVEVAVIAEELSYGLVDAAFLGPTLAAELRRIAGLPAAAGETVALRPDLSAPSDAGGAAVAIDAAGATVALGIGDGRLVERPLAAPSASVDLTRPSVPLLADAGATPIGDRPLDPADLERWVALGLAVTSAELVGTMRGAIDLAGDYAKERRQYGVAIGSFQAVQHLLADAFVAMEGSRSVALHAAWAVDALPPADAVTAGAVAKAYCSRAARTVCETAIQVHGGIGNTWECLAHVHLRRALLSTDVLGGADVSLARVLAARGIGDGHGLR